MTDTSSGQFFNGLLVAILDALGAAAYPDAKIREFLAARSQINSDVRSFAKGIPDETYRLPEIFTFGDTVILASRFSKDEDPSPHMGITIMALRRYLYYSMKKGILFRGAFSIGEYIADSQSNTVMGEAVSDAASWYQESEWVGVCSTPKAKISVNHLEHAF